MFSNFIEKIKDHKIIVITIAAVIAVIVMLVILLSGNGESTENNTLKAISKGNNTKTATVIVKADIPEGYYWHVDGFNSEATPVTIVKESSKKLKLKIKGKEFGGYTLSISCDNQPTFENEDEEAEYILNHTADEIQYKDNLFILSCDYSVSRDNKVKINSFDAPNELKPVEIVSDMLYPIEYFPYDDELQFIIKNDEKDWTIECSNPRSVTVAGPFTNNAGEMLFTVTPNNDGSGTVKLLNYSVNYGIEFEAITSSEYYDENGDEATDTNAIVLTEKYISMGDLKIIGEDELIINYEEIDKLEEIREVVKKIPLPVGAVVKDNRNMGLVDDNGEYDENGSDVASMELRYLNKNIDYVVTEKQTPEQLLSGVDEYMSQLGAEKKVETINDVEVIMYSLANGEAEEDTPEGDEPISYIACWQYEGVTCMIQEENSTYNILNKFVSTLELR